MGQFDFSNQDNEGTYAPEWHHEPIEHRDAGLFDNKGRRIGFEIHRAVRIRDGSQLHTRWVSVTKDGEWIQNNSNSFHVSWEEAEAEVERHISRSLARYARISAEQNASSSRAFGLGDSVRTRTTNRPKRGDAKNFSDGRSTADNGLDGCAQQAKSCIYVLMLAGGLMLLRFVLAMLDAPRPQ